MIATISSRNGLPGSRHPTAAHAISTPLNRFSGYPAASDPPDANLDRFCDVGCAAAPPTEPFLFPHPRQKRPAVPERPGQRAENRPPASICPPPGSAKYGLFLRGMENL